MKKLIFCLTLCILIFCGCRKVTYISREDQLAQMVDHSTTQSQTSDTTQATGSTATSAVKNDSDPSDTTAGKSDADTTKSTEAYGDTESTKDSEITKESEGSKTTESTKSTEGTKVTEGTRATENTKATGSSKPTQPESTSVKNEDSTSSTDSTEPPETTGAIADDPYDISDYGVQNISYSAHAAINEQRAAAGVGELTLDGYLCAIASVRAYECSQYWSHNRLDGRGWSTVLGDYGYGYSAAAENLAQGGSGMGGEYTVLLWAGSEGHMANMINPNYTRVGIASYDYNGMTYVACLFVG